MNGLYEGYRSFFAWILQALSFLGEAWLLVLISAVAGAALVFLYKFVSPQKHIAHTKKLITANILESVLFRNDIGTSLQAQGRALLLSLKYASLAIPALFALAIPALLVLGQLFPNFGITYATPGQKHIVTARFSEAIPESIAMNARGAVLSDPIRIDALNEVSWSVDVESEDPVIELQSGAERQSVELISRNSLASTGIQPLWSAWVLGAETSKIEGLKSLSIDYQYRTILWLGIEWNWVILFLVISLVIGIVFSKVFKVEI